MWVLRGAYPIQVSTPRSLPTALVVIHLAALMRLSAKYSILITESSDLFCSAISVLPSLRLSGGCDCNLEVREGESIRRAGWFPSRTIPAESGNPADFPHFVRVFRALSGFFSERVDPLACVAWKRSCDPSFNHQTWSDFRIETAA